MKTTSKRVEPKSAYYVITRCAVCGIEQMMAFGMTEFTAWAAEEGRSFDPANADVQLRAMTARAAAGERRPVLCTPCANRLQRGEVQVFAVPAQSAAVM